MVFTHSFRGMFSQVVHLSSHKRRNPTSEFKTSVYYQFRSTIRDLALEYRRINLGQVRTENRFTATFIIANIGSFGNLRRQENIF
jgi:hypothetical protein